jgi:hypothetical protein
LTGGVAAQSGAPPVRRLAEKVGEKVGERDEVTASVGRQRGQRLDRQLGEIARGVVAV